MTLEREDCFDNQYYVFIRRLLTIVGLWPYLESTKRLPYVFFVSVLMFLGLYSQIYIMLTSERKVEVIVELSQTLIPTILFPFAYWNLLYNSALIRKIFECVRKDWNELTFEDELNTMQTYALKTKVSTHGIACAFCFYCLFLILPSIWCHFLYISGIAQQTKWILPVNDELFVATKWMYYTVFLFQLLIILTECVVGITHYSTFILLLQHSCALFIIVTKKIDRPFIKNEYKFCWTHRSTKREAELEWIVAVVKNYNNAIKFVELIRSLYGKMYIAEVALLFCCFIIDFIYFVRLLSLVTTAGEAFKSLFYINGSVLTIYAYFDLGERLMEHSTSVYAKCLLVPFYTLNVQTNKLFLLLLTRSMKPCHISIGGIVVASHELFAKMVKTSFSFATIFYNVR